MKYYSLNICNVMQVKESTRLETAVFSYDSILF